ncbi:MAG: protein phosphatase 2C domain-containing protein [Candidatus Nealsonbacteria bacterium]|nr:protein phosphatase 2C domain-containing protein [Candidatus Nealsonbacteria bacterium]
MNARLPNTQVAFGTVVGRDHLKCGKVLVGRNNQDAVVVRQSDRALVGVVCDGCGGEEHSEFGARLGANLVSQSVLRNAGIADPIEDVLDRVHGDVLAELRILVRHFGDDPAVVIRNHFLFTIVGVLVRPGTLHLFALGDGTWAVANNLENRTRSVHSLGPFPDNAPPYLGYAIDGSRSPNVDSFRLIRTIHNTGEPHAVLIGSDGAADLADAADRVIPGTRELVGPISDFWQDDRYFRNPQMINRKLRRLNTDTQRVVHGKIHPFHGLLHDDTTLLVVRRNSIGE